MPTLTFLHSGTRVAVPHDPEGEREVVAAHSEYQAALQRSRQNPEGGVPIEELMERHGVVKAGAQPKRPGGQRAKGESGNVRVRMPRKLHKELANQAEREGVSLNTLIVTYLAREAGVRSVLAG